MGTNIAQISKEINIKTLSNQQPLTTHQKGKQQKRKTNKTLKRKYREIRHFLVDMDVIFNQLTSFYGTF